DLVVGRERRRAAIRDDRERALLRRRVVLREGVDPLRDADARRIVTYAFLDVSLGDRVGRRIDVEAERGFVVLRRIGPGIGARVLVGDTVVRGGRGLRRPRWRGGQMVILVRRSVRRPVRGTAATAGDEGSG